MNKGRNTQDGKRLLAIITRRRETEAKQHAASEQQADDTSFLSPVNKIKRISAEAKLERQYYQAVDTKTKSMSAKQEELNRAKVLGAVAKMDSERDVYAYGVPRKGPKRRKATLRFTLQQKTDEILTQGYYRDIKSARGETHISTRQHVDRLSHVEAKKQAANAFLTHTQTLLYSARSPLNR